jgi:hypothetical protein
MCGYRILKTRIQGSTGKANMVYGSQLTRPHLSIANEMQKSSMPNSALSYIEEATVYSKLRGYEVSR